MPISDSQYLKRRNLKKKIPSGSISGSCLPRNYHARSVIGRKIHATFYITYRKGIRKKKNVRVFLSVDSNRLPWKYFVVRCRDVDKLYVRIIQLIRVPLNAKIRGKNRLPRVEIIVYEANSASFDKISFLFVEHVCWRTHN